MPEAYLRPVRAITVTATGPALPGAGVLYFARLVAAGAATAVIKDGDDTVLSLALAAGGVDDWPKAPIALAYDKSLSVTLTGTGSALHLGYDTRR